MFEINIIIVYGTLVRIARIIISAWSWKKVSCSVMGDAICCKFIFVPVVTVLLKVKLLYMLSLNLPHLASMLDIY